ncbi:hypothetical protein HDE_00794 [Halotydeus destructor]|nr:hypothetical protein HDE_00794 [Halotydeus destructor]
MATLMTGSSHPKNHPSYSKLERLTRTLRFLSKTFTQKEAMDTLVNLIELDINYNLLQLCKSDYVLKLFLDNVQEPKSRKAAQILQVKWSKATDKERRSELFAIQNTAKKSRRTRTMAKVADENADPLPGSSVVKVKVTDNQDVVRTKARILKSIANAANELAAHTSRPKRKTPEPEVVSLKRPRISSFSRDEMSPVVKSLSYEFTSEREMKSTCTHASAKVVKVNKEVNETVPEFDKFCVPKNVQELQLAIASNWFTAFEVKTFSSRTYSETVTIRNEPSTDVKDELLTFPRTKNLNRLAVRRIFTSLLMHTNLCELDHHVTFDACITSAKLENELFDTFRLRYHYWEAYANLVDLLRNPKHRSTKLEFIESTISPRELVKIAVNMKFRKSTKKSLQDLLTECKRLAKVHKV